MYISDIHRLDMVHILYIMLNFDEVYISDIPPAVSIATWYIYYISSTIYKESLWNRLKKTYTGSGAVWIHQIRMSCEKRGFAVEVLFLSNHIYRSQPILSAWVYSIQVQVNPLTAFRKKYILFSF